MPAPPPDRRTELAGRLRSGARWFHWVAALALLNSVISLFVAQWNFIFSLGLTQILDAVGRGLADDGGGLPPRLLMLAVSAGAVAPYGLCGLLAARGRAMGFLAGMAFYGLDGGIFLLAGDWLGIAFHVFALLGMGRGYGALRAMRALPADDAEPPAEAPETTAVAAAAPTPAEAIVAAVEEAAEREGPVEAAR